MEAYTAYLKSETWSKMVSRTVKRETLFSWHTNFDWTVEGGDIYIWVYPDPDTQLKIKLSAGSADQMKQIRSQILNWMSQTDEWSGTVEERWEKQLVDYPAKKVSEWVRVK